MRNGLKSVVLACSITLLGLSAPVLLAAQAPEVYFVLEGQDSATGGPVVTLMGKRLTRFQSFLLVEAGSQVLEGTPQVIISKPTLLSLRLEADLAPGLYELRAMDKSGVESTFPVRVGNGSPLPGMVTTGSLDPALKDDLDDAVTLGGQLPAFYRDAGNINTGAMDTDYFSAYDDLQAEGKVGSSGSQVAAGDHDHDDTYAKKGLVGAKVFLATLYSYSTPNIDPIPFDAEEFDTDNCHNSANKSRLTCNTPGFYLVTVKAYFYLGSPSTVLARLLKNGSPVSYHTQPFGTGVGEATLVSSTIIELAEGDYLEALTTPPIGVGGGGTLKEGQGFTEFSMVRLGE